MPTTIPIRRTLLQQLESGFLISKREGSAVGRAVMKMVLPVAAAVPKDGSLSMTLPQSAAGRGSSTRISDIVWASHLVLIMKGPASITSTMSDGKLLPAWYV